MVNHTNDKHIYVFILLKFDPNGRKSYPNKLIKTKKFLKNIVKSNIKKHNTKKLCFSGEHKIFYEIFCVSSLMPPINKTNLLLQYFFPYTDNFCSFCFS